MKFEFSSFTFKSSALQFDLCSDLILWKPSDTILLLLKMSRSKRILRFFDVFWTLSNNWTQTNINGNVAMTNWPPTESHPVTANRAVSRLLFSNIKLQTTLDSISFDFSASTLQNYAHRSGIRFDKVLSCTNHCTWLVYVRGLLNFREERQRKPLPCHWKIGTTFSAISFPNSEVWSVCWTECHSISKHLFFGISRT